MYRIDACCRCQDSLIIPHFVPEMLLWPPASRGFATEGNPVAEPDHTWDHYEKQGGPHLGRLWDRSGSLSPVPVDAGSIENGSF